MAEGGLFGETPPGLDGYVCISVGIGASADLLEDLAGIEWSKWLSRALRSSFAEACHGGEPLGCAGAFEGVAADAMPNYWRKSAADGAWLPDPRHPVGKWMADASSRLLALPAPEMLDAVLRRHSILGSRDPCPAMRRNGEGFALLVHRPKAGWHKLVGLREDASLLKLWFPGAA